LAVAATISAATISVSTVTLVAPAGTPSASASPSDFWHLDRINQRSLPVDGNVALPATGAGVDIYVVDGTVRHTHSEFSGRAVVGWDAMTNKTATSADSTCNGHGTHVAALSAGTNVGTAPGARVIPVRALGCGGSGEIGAVVSALQWIARHHRSGRLAVVNLSLGVVDSVAAAPLSAAVTELVADGVVVVAAAGNDASSTRACSTVPANHPQVLTVGAVDVGDSRSVFSNDGSCVDIFAPGGGSTSVRSAWITGDTTYRRMNGTSMASPLVAGYAAQLAAAQPTLCPAQITDAIVDRATTGAISGISPGTPNRLLYLDTSPITGATTPGKPTEVIASGNDGAMRVTWDAPCAGGSSLSGFTVTLWDNATAVRVVETDGSARSVRMAGLTNGVRYSATVRARNAVGEGPESGRTPGITVRRLRRGTTVRIRDIIREAGGGVGSVSVARSSRSVCSVRTRPLRLVARSRGRCRLVVRSRHAADTVTHILRVR
jgi:subtilisin family serine protease